MSHARKSPATSAVETTQVILPPDTNHHGTAFGGRIMQWMDITAGIAAARHCQRQVVTAAVDDLYFAKPIRLGDVVIIKAAVNFAGKTSMEVGVRVEREEATTGRREHALTGYLTFVAVDGNGRPIYVDPVVPETADEKRRYADAERRRETRLSKRVRPA